MSDKPTNDSSNEETFVDVNTDDLDQFSSLMSGKAKPAPEEEAEDEGDAVENSEEVETLANEDEEGNEQEETDEEESPDGEDDDSEEKPAKPKNRFQERINDLTAKARDAERKAADFEARLALAEKAQQNPTQEEKEAKPVVEENSKGSPTPDEKTEDGKDKYPLGEFDPTYIRDLTRFTIKQEQEAAKQADEQARAKQAVEEVRSKLQEDWTNKIQADAEKYEDFFEKGAELEETFKGIDDNYGEYLATTIMAMDKGPDVLYYLANNLEEAEQIVASGPTKATIALGRLESLFLAEKNAKAKETKVSKAPVPPQVNKGNKGRTTVADDTDDLDAFSEKMFTGKRGL